MQNRIFVKRIFIKNILLVIFLFNYFNFFYREFLFILQKIVLVFIISFVKIGPNEKIDQNNSFFCIIICMIVWYAQTKTNPFITPELNYLSSRSFFTIILSIFLNFFISFCENQILEMFLLGLFFINNASFMLLVLKNYLQINIVFPSSCFLFHVFEIFFSKFSYFSNLIEYLNI